MNSYPRIARWWVPAGLCTVLIALSAYAVASDTSTPERTRRYQEDRQACLRGDTNQVQSACLNEAKARFTEKPGTALEPTPAQLLQNASLRCDVLKGADRDDCLARMRGEGTTQGSAQSGGIYRELVTPGRPAR